MKSKYGDTIEKVLEAKEEKIQRRDELLDYDAYLNQLKEQKKASEEALEKASKKLSKIRKKYAKELCRQVTEHLLDLNFETVDLSMEFEQTTHFTSNGYDEVEFLISTNPGETPKPLGKIASGHLYYTPASDRSYGRYAFSDRENRGIRQDNLKDPQAAAGRERCGVSKDAWRCQYYGNCFRKCKRNERISSKNKKILV